MFTAFEELSKKRAYICDFAGDRCRCHHGRTHEQRASRRRSLATFEVSIRGGGAELNVLAVYRDSWQGTLNSQDTPFKAGSLKESIETLRFRLGFDPF